MPFPRKLFIILAVSLHCTIALAQFRVADAGADKWARDDKVAHFFCNYVISDVTRHFFSDAETIPIILAGNILWEVKDGFVPYEKYGFWGGEGFSTKDVLAGAAGMGLNYLVRELLDRRDPMERDRKARERLAALRRQKPLRLIDE